MILLSHLLIPHWMY